MERLGRALGDRYHIERELGAGGMAIVYLATDLRQHRPVALKVLRPELVSSIGPERFLREIEISGKLNHPHILPLFDAGEADGLPFFVMPFIAGESLRDRLTREGELPVADALQITREVGDALSYAHAHGIVHRDIKPENIMLSSGHAMVADFGIARAITVAGEDRKLTGTGMAIGTVDYMSPEQATGSGQVDERSDLYSLACVLYEMLTGGPPFPAPTAQGVLARHLVDPVPPIRTVRPSVTVPVEAAILAALGKSKADRFSSVVAFLQALEGKRPSPAQAYPAAGDPRVRRRSAFIATGVAVVMLSSLAAYLLLRAPALGDRRVLVGLFEDHTGDPGMGGLAAGATAAIVSGLASTGMVQPVDVRSLTPELGAGSDLVTLRRLARRVGARSVVSGSIARRGDSLDIQISLTDAATGGLLHQALPLAWPATNAPAVAPRLAQRVMAAYGAYFDPHLRNYPAVSQPASYEAFREFQLGIKLHREARWFEDAEFVAIQNHFNRSIVLDPAFMGPRTWAANMYAIWGKCRQTDSVVTGIHESDVHLLPADQADLDYAVAVCRHDVRGAYAAVSVLVELSPGVAENVPVFALAALGVNRPLEALTCLARLDRIPEPDAESRSFCRNLMLKAYHQLGQYREALRLVERIRAESPDTPLLERYQMRQWAALGDVVRVTALIDQRVEKSSQEVPAGEDMLVIGEELRGHGEPAAGRALCERGVAWFATRPASQQAASRWTVASLLYCAERWEEARVAYERLASENSSETGAGMSFRIRLGALAVRRGDSSAVTRLDQWLAARDTLPGASSGRAVLAALRGDLARAFPLFQFGWERGQPGFEIAHDDPTLEALRSYPPIRALIYGRR